MWLSLFTDWLLHKRNAVTEPLSMCLFLSDPYNLGSMFNFPPYQIQCLIYLNIRGMVLKDIWHSLINMGQQKFTDILLSQFMI